MEAAINSFLLVVFSEMGDKTQLLALVLAARFKKPVPIMFGILVATLLNHFLASYAGNSIQSLIAPLILKWLLACTFVGFGLWLLIPDKGEDVPSSIQWGPFLTTTITFFFAEMGDKTQLATLALGAHYASPVLVTIGTTLGMLVADGLAVIFGSKLIARVSMPVIHKVASALFIIFGIIIALK